jgi:hypothetical protein
MELDAHGIPAFFPDGAGEKVYQPLVERTWASVDVPRLNELPAPSGCGPQRIAGVDLQKPRMQAVAAAVIALAAAPAGFPVKALAEQTKRHPRRPHARCGTRQAADELKKLRAKGLVERAPKTRRYRVRRPAIQILAGWFILREKVLKPVLAGVCRPPVGRPLKCASRLDEHYRTLQQQMRRTLEHLNLAA